MSDLALYHNLPEYTRPSIPVGEANIFAPRRNPHLAKWDILFDKKNAEWISFKPHLGLEVYPCYACRDMFVSRNSFLDHVNRRGMLLKYKCSFCGQSDPLIFYNPCSFLLHTRQHYTLTSGEIHLEGLEVSLLPYGLGGFLPDPSVSPLYHVQDDNIGETSFINTRFYSPMQESKGRSVIHLLPNELLFFFSQEPNAPLTSLVLKQISSNIPRCQFVTLDNDRFTSDCDSINNSSTVNNVSIKEEPQEATGQNNFQYNMPIITKIETINETNNDTVSNLNPSFNENIENFPRCPECREVQTVSMGEHFLKTNKPFQDSLKCSLCKYIAPTKCSLKAHERIHESMAPFVCPECGKDFNNCQLLLAHLEEVCFHLTKQVRLRCPGKKCGKIFAQVGTFSAHFVAHMQNLSKCIVCDNIFFTEMEFLEHKKTHTVKVPSVKVYRCTVCTDVFELFTTSTMQQHIYGHATSRKQCLYVYICKRCHSYFRSTLTYATHLLRCFKPFLHSNSHLQTKRDSRLSIGGKRKRKSNLLQISGTCLTCKTQIKIQVQHYDNAPVNCANCDKPLSYGNNLKKNNVHRAFFKADFEDTSIVACNKKNTIISKVKCILCQEKLMFNEMNDHFALKKCKFHNPVVVLDSKISYSGISNVSSKTEETSRKKRKKTFNSKSKKLSVPNSESDLSTEPEEPIPFDGTYRCKLCNYCNTVREQFHKHIIEHRDVRTAYQCMECGECFVVKPSLGKHLLYYHQVTDIETYFNENNCFNKEAVKELENIMRLAPGESKEPVAENQCRVCMQQFKDSLELNKHFRVHGMAFLLKNSK